MQRSLQILNNLTKRDEAATFIYRKYKHKLKGSLALFIKGGALSATITYLEMLLLYSRKDTKIYTYT